MQKLQKYVKNKKFLLNKVYSLYKTLPKDLHDIKYNISSGDDFITLMFYSDHNTYVQVYFDLYRARDGKLSSTKNFDLNSASNHNINELESVLREKFK